MATISTPYMNLALPIPTVELGPAWAFDLNAALGLIDSHTHLPGQGQPVPTAGLNINADLPMNHFNLTLTRSTRYDNQITPLSLAADINNVYVSGGNLWYNNSIGQQVQLTSGSGLNIAGTGTIGGDYGQPGVPAVVDYFLSPANTYYFFQDTNKYAPIATGPITISGITTSAFGVTISVPGGLSAPYSLTLPTTLPGQTNVMTLGSSGNIDSITYDAVGQGMTSVGANAIAASVTRSTSQTVGIGGVAMSPVQTIPQQTTNNTANTDIVGVSVTITTSGRPVFVGWVSGGGGTAYLQVINGGSDDGLFGITRNGATQVASQQYTLIPRSGVGAIWGIDVVGAGTYTYQAIFHVTGSSGTQVSTTGLAITAYEL